MAQRWRAASILRASSRPRRPRPNGFAMHDASPSLPPHPGWARVAARIGPAYDALAPAVRASRIAPAQTEPIGDDAYFALSDAYQKHLDRIAAEVPRLAATVNELADVVTDATVPAPALDRACDDIVAHLRACAAWSERLSRVAPPLGFQGMFEPLRQIPAEFFERFAAYLTVARAAAEGRPPAKENIVHLNVQSLLDAATAAGHRQIERLKAEQNARVAEAEKQTTDTNRGCWLLVALLLAVALGFGVCGFGP